MDLEEQYERLLRYCFGKVKNREQAEDITQEAFLKLWQMCFMNLNHCFAREDYLMM